MSERIARVLSARLEELAYVAEHSGAPAPAVARLLEAASVATMHAVALDLLTAAQAKAIWHEAAERHPVIDRGSTEPLRDAA